ncbi:hypothetical protein [Brachybacterium sp. FME24]|uniref:hypothetical protein n=1 Tax=Brachybacterium sp. FME24 TaxID=2742605 RepID=UPI0018683046|nr:hypothetical protein [Brachybacterium sp. FME24]
MRASTARILDAVQAFLVAGVVILLGLAWALDGIQLEQNTLAGFGIVVIGLALCGDAVRRFLLARRLRRGTAPRDGGR